MRSNETRCRPTDHGHRNPRSGRGGRSQTDNGASQVVSRRKPRDIEIHKIATWNVTTMYEAAKLVNIQQEMTRLKIPILGVCETKWPGSNILRSNGYIIYHSGKAEGPRSNGVAIIVKEEIRNCVQNFVPFNDRIMMIQLKSKLNIINLIQVYAPTADKPDEEIEQFYSQIKQILRSTKKHEANIIMGDFNSKVGAISTENITGRFGLGERNERGHRLIQFCQEEECIIANTWFQQPKRRLYTWKSPADREGQIVRNQIDYILINRRFRNSITSAKTYPSADAATNHNLLCAEFNLKLKRMKAPTIRMKPDNRLLRNPIIANDFKNKINCNIKKQLERSKQATVAEKLDILNSAMVSTGNEVLKPEKDRIKKKDWMTDKILDLIQQRRRWKNKDEARYREIYRQIRFEVKKAKETWMEQKCREMEELQRKHDEFNIHKKLKEITYTQRKRTPHFMRNSKGKIILDLNEKKEEWTKYIKDLFFDTRTPLKITKCTNTGPSILKAEVEKAIHQSKTGKAPGPDQIPSDWLKFLNDENVSELTNIFNHIYETGIVPQIWLESTFIPIPKKPNTSSCNDFRLISLMSHSLKLLLKIILNRIKQKCEETMGNKQFGFRDGLGTREALFSMLTLLQRSWEVQKPIYVCFIDFEKAFDRVQHDRLFKYLETTGIDNRDLRLIQNIYWEQKASVLVDDNETDKIIIQRGVRQGCVLSPTLFNVYSEVIFNEALEGQCGVRTGGETINNIRYADDTAIMAESIEDLQFLIDRVTRECSNNGLSINTSKTKMLVVSKRDVGHTQLIVNNEPITKVNHFKYLGCWINDKLDPDEEIKTRIQLARGAFVRLKSILCNSQLNLHLRIKFLKCYVYPVLLYGCETWIMKVNMMNRLEALEMWCYRRMLKISWVQRISNMEVLNRIGQEEGELTKMIKKRKLEYLGHIMRGNRYSILQLILNGKIEGKRGIGRKKYSWLRNLRQWTGLSADELLHAAQDRERYRQIVMEATNA